ncbi:response regulator [Gloeobacter kilaueensis]|uniref:Response regulator receiver protein n=1 Tax=Gloeobacter kilaueensis (strain ATCC BAA-2537 / CCAP 1431/1 / ULC 316 / JS1) TaxID=1183438 RepID=U5QJR3_GLOK1|nr:response regulator [Gloeobacter kilaueensis]AGY59133.1 response regulator receiver protein [Gloeobacter kilaueensis JS1]
MSRCVLIVDDEEDIRAVAQLGLDLAAGWQVLTAASGSEAIAVASRQQPDVILLDVMMPDLDGQATLARLKADPATRTIPVILMTAKVQSTDQQNFAALEVAAVFTKPFRPMQLAAQICSALGWSSPEEMSPSPERPPPAC